MLILSIDVGIKNLAVYIQIFQATNNVLNFGILLTYVMKKPIHVANAQRSKIHKK